MLDTEYSPSPGAKSQSEMMRIILTLSATDIDRSRRRVAAIPEPRLAEYA